MKPHFPFRLGVPSCLYPADLVSEARYLGPLADDMELVLFEVDGLCNFPTPGEVAAMRELAEVHDLTYTVHLPLDLILEDGHDLWSNRSMEKARQVIRMTRDLAPWAYVMHLDGVAVEEGASATTVARWQERSLRIMEAIGREIGEMQLVALENLENYNPEVFAPIFDRLPISACVDIGHFFKYDHDPLPYLRSRLERTRVIHLHGSRDQRDHRGLDLADPAVLAEVFMLLTAANYRGVLTLEVFEQEHFLAGRDLILSLIGERCGLEVQGWAGS
ncbi:MAG: cobamide remodeling phosphodiesterase CbiR [Anaerolineae bacterium]|jgi:sugar phosphate isomerase/epimerase|nr:cobamide remodeling phosphodiesterase CbiR [Anaerolineae bacterium]